MNKELMFSSKSNEWDTPQMLFDKLNEVFNFTLDPCSTRDNHKCEKYYTIEEDGLKQDWSKEIVFMNPPYSKSENPCKHNCKKKKCVDRGYHISEYKPGQEDWIKKAYEENLKGSLIVALLPVRTETKAQHKYIFGKAKAIVFIKGRLSFGDGNDSAPFPSQLVIYTKELNQKQIQYLKTIGYLIIM